MATASKDTVHSDSINVSEQELGNVKLALARLWELDYNRLKPGKDYEVNLERARRGHEAPRDLFKRISPEALQKPTFKTFLALLDNYIPQTGIPEVVTAEELKEDYAFIRAVCQTAPMIYVHKYLLAKKLVPKEQPKFAKKLHDLWFDMYAREHRAGDSSAFEHAFLGEIRDNEAKGFHNWINFLYLQRKGDIQYLGFVPSRAGGRRLANPDGDEHVISLRLKFKGYIKAFSTSFIGTSPEFEISLYTLLFFLKRENTELIIDDIKLNIKVYDFFKKGERELGSAFPEIVGHVDIDDDDD